MKRKNERIKSEAEAKAKEREERILEWVPKTELGKRVFNKEIESLRDLFAAGKPVKEPEIIDYITEIQEKVVSTRKTTKVVRSGRKFSYSAAVLVGNGDGFVGIGTANDKERWNAIRKASQSARLNIISVRRGCGSWECSCKETHSVPFKVKGKNASVRVQLMPAPKGVGLGAGDNIKDVLKFAGIKDVWSKGFGATDTRLNFVRAAIDALKETTKQKASSEMKRKIEIISKQDRG